MRGKFTGYERDAETGLDYARARYLASAQGRFAGADPLLASGRAGAPQTWNRYSYALNNPLRLTDPSGMMDEEVDEGIQQAQASPQKPKPTPQPQLPAVNNATKEQKELLNTGSAEAIKLMNNETCGALFGGTAQGQQALSSFSLNIDPSLPKDGHPQGVFKGDHIDVNPHGSSFVTPDDGSYTFFIFNPTMNAGVQSVTLSGVSARAFPQLHETGHKTNSFGKTDEDGFAPQTFMNNYINNWKVWNACFSDVKPVRARNFPIPLP